MLHMALREQWHCSLQAWLSSFRQVLLDMECTGLWAPQLTTAAQPHILPDLVQAWQAGALSQQARQLLRGQLHCSLQEAVLHPLRGLQRL